MAVRALAWNVKDGLGEPDRAPVLLDAVERLAPDVAGFSEAYAEGADVSNTVSTLRKLGYTVMHTPYHDTDGRKDRHGLLLAIHEDVLPQQPSQYPRPLWLASRFAIQGTVQDPETGESMTTLLTHLNDRSWAGRNIMLEAYRTQRMAGNMNGARAILTDANSADRNDPYSKLMRRAQVLRPFMRPLYRDPDPTVQQSKLMRKISLGYRTTDMGRDDIVDQFEADGLRDADPTHAPTIPAENPKMRLDHIFVSKEVHVLSNAVGDFNAEADHGVYRPASDHLYIMSDLLVIGRQA
ncbi:MAG TPA: endonuclease/exonuclease/phosphatase family protein [Candidatus Saccharimonadales bacterium]|nr:endonuclease/exonuclease/phosphatase family protein [Candidatus Saccharimonadales bacterium]